MPLTFADVASAFDKAMKDKDSGPLNEILSEDFSWRILARKDGACANKKQTIYWNLKTDKVQSNYKTVYESEKLVVGTFNITSPDEKDSIVLCLGHLNREGSQVILCEHLNGPYTEGIQGMGKMGFLL